MKKLTIFVVLLTLILVACERPAPTENVVPSDTDTTDPLEFPTAPAEGDTDVGQPTAVPPIDSTDPITSTQGDASDPALEGVQPTPTTAPIPTETSTAPNTEQIHTVIQGDTLYALSLLYGVSSAEIVAANNLSNPDSLEVGQQLVIPVPGTVDLGGDPPADDGDPAPSEEISYIVQPGDTLYRIGLAYGFTVEELADYNNIADPTSLDIGQEILIPPSE